MSWTWANISSRGGSLIGPTDEVEVARDSLSKAACTLVVWEINLSNNDCLGTTPSGSESLDPSEGIDIDLIARDVVLSLVGKILASSLFLLLCREGSVPCSGGDIDATNSEFSSIVLDRKVAVLLPLASSARGVSGVFGGEPRRDDMDWCLVMRLLCLAAF